jgi:inorganic pyrophosphatase
MNQSFNIAKKFLGTKVEVIIDRPLGSLHPKWNFKYPVNYGFIKNTISADGEELDVYVLKVNQPLKTFTGQVVAIIHRLNDDDDKLVVIPVNDTITNQEIEQSVEFQEKWFKHKIVR